MPCTESSEYVQTVDRRFGKLNVAMAGPHSVVDASYEQCDSETLFHLTLSTPLLVLLLILGVGTLPRAITPCFCLLGSVPASRSLVVLVKALWPDLNMVGPDTQILFVQLALAFDYALFFWVRFSQERPIAYSSRGGCRAHENTADLRLCHSPQHFYSCDYIPWCKLLP